MLGQRALTAIILAPIAIAVMLFLPTIAVAVIIGAVCLQALWEWARLAGIESRALRGAVVAANVLLLAGLWTLRDQPFGWIVIATGLAWWLLSMLWLRNFSYAAAPTRENAAIKLVAAEFAILPAWLALMTLHASSPHGHGWALFSLVLIWAADIAAFFAGKRYGTTKLAPRISPNKTTAGAWGALLGAGIVALVGSWWLDMRGPALIAVVALSLLAVAASIVGDLFESLLKRQANVKDSGTLFPGHGGLLDRIDSLLAAIPVFVAGMALLDIALRP